MDPTDADADHAAAHSCPLKIYAPTRPLDFGNQTYSPSAGYQVENMGPASVERGRLMEEPRYADKFARGVPAT